MGEWLVKICWVVVLSAIKFLGGFLLALGYGFNPLFTFFCTVGGGMLGVIFYLYLWQFILNLKNKFFPSKLKPFKFKKSSRLMVKIIRKYEVYGIALLSPIISIPLGTILAAAIEENKWRIKIIMLGSFSLWVSVLIGLQILFGIDLNSLFK
jgi:hypothetical protein